MKQFHYLLVFPLVFLVSCEALAPFVEPIMEAAKDPEVQAQAKAIADDALGANYVGALYGIGALVAAFLAKKGGKAVVDKLKKSEEGKLL